MSDLDVPGTVPPPDPGAFFTVADQAIAPAFLTVAPPPVAGPPPRLLPGLLTGRRAARSVRSAAPATAAPHGLPDSARSAAADTPVRPAPAARPDAPATGSATGSTTGPEVPAPAAAPAPRPARSYPRPPGSGDRTPGTGPVDPPVGPGGQDEPADLDVPARPPWVADAVRRGARAGVGAAVLGLGATLVPVIAVVVATAVTGDGPPATTALRVASALWLAGHRAGLDITDADGTVTLGVTPLALTAGYACVLVRAARRVLGGGPGPRPGTGAATGARASAVAVVALAAGYAAVAAAVASASATPALGCPPGRAALAAGVAALAVAGAVALCRSRADRGGVPRTGAGGALLLVAAGAVTFAAALAWRARPAVEIAREVAPGTAGSLALCLVGAALAPNAAVWAVAYATGPGFTVGAGTTVALAGTTTGTLPALPSFAALPPPGPAGPWAWATLAGPVLAGLGTGVLAARSCRPGERLRPAGVAAGGAVVAGAWVAAGAWLAGGRAGTGLLAHVGPVPWLAGAAAAGALLVVAPPVAVVTGWWRGRAARVTSPDGVLDAA